ncbi:MAG TPA: AMP-binding protein, partial [Longimicrobium sp.]|nr:AMP-binding protein [Longimicrobium sp.]
DHLFLFTCHHAIVDGWSVPILWTEWMALYREETGGIPADLPPAPRFRDYVAWMLRHDPADAEAFWRAELAGMAPTPLPLAPPAGDVAPGFALERRMVSRALWDRLHAFARGYAVTPATLVLGAWTLLLARYAGEDEAVCGIAISGRPAEVAGVDRMVGMFVNALPARVPVPPEQPVREWLARLQEHTADIREHGYVKLNSVREWVGLPHETPLFDTLMVFENFPWGSDGETTSGLRVSTINHVDRTSFPLTLLAVPRETLELRLTYDPHRYSAAEGRLLADSLETLLSELAADPDRPLGALSPIPPAERLQLATWERGPALTAPAEPVHRVVERRAEATPHAVAIVGADRTMTYAELDASAARLARRLRALGVGPEVRVAVSLERSPEMAVATLGVLRAGGCCVPIDPAYPAERRAFILADSRASVLVTERSLVATLPATDARLLLIDEGNAEEAPDAADHTESREIGGGSCPATIIVGAGRQSAPSPRRFWERGLGGEGLPGPLRDQRSTRIPDHAIHPENLAYVLYTSGSTGRPKGVAMAHGALSVLLRWQVERWGGDAAARTLQLASLSFDVSFQEMFATWWAGGTLVLVDEWTRRDPDALVAHMRAERVERCFLPFAALQALAGADDPHLPDLRDVVTAGEALRITPQLRAFFHANPRARLENQYGPTETHVVAAHALEGSADRWEALPPVGRPVAGTRLYVLDSTLRTAPAGAPGELYAAGESPARGYLGRPALTAERFLPDPHAAEPGARMYRTGDRARWRLDGSLEFMGRADNQVKVRGHRVEPGEVEVVLAEHPEVAAAAVVARDDERGGSVLAAYVVARGSVAPTELREHLAALLPEYMVPATFTVLDAFPLTPSGKTDRRALPEPGGASSAEHVEPTTETERALATIWSELLKVDTVSATDNFFWLGGHSLVVTRLMSSLRAQLGVEVPLRILYDTPVLAEQAARVDAIQAAVVEAMMADLESMSDDEVRDALSIGDS